MTSPLHVLWKSIVLPVKVIFSTADLTFRAGVKVGGLPVKGSAALTRALGWKLVGALTLGVVLGFLIGRKVALLGHDHGHDHDHSHDHTDDHSHDHGDDELAGAAV